MIQKEKPAMAYLDWYHELRKMLLDNYGLKIEDDIYIFAKLINDFKNQGYDAYETTNEYTTALSLRRRGNSKTILCPSPNDTMREISKMQESYLHF